MDFGLAYYRTYGALRMSSGGRKENGKELEGRGKEMRWKTGTVVNPQPGELTRRYMGLNTGT